MPLVRRKEGRKAVDDEEDLFKRPRGKTSSKIDERRDASFVAFHRWTKRTVSAEVQEVVGGVVKLTVDGEMVPPVQPVVESGRQRQAGDVKIVTNGGSSVQLES
ncbi:hypothetical protein D1007_43204 [Hordeum vulgare]|nr:hypothetical protein D1007_43204 [Hordeum vulgare]